MGSRLVSLRPITTHFQFTWKSSPKPQFPYTLRNNTDTKTHTTHKTNTHDDMPVGFFMERTLLFSTPASTGSSARSSTIRYCGPSSRRSPHGVTPVAAAIPDDLPSTGNACLKMTGYFAPPVPSALFSWPRRWPRPAVSWTPPRCCSPPAPLPGTRRARAGHRAGRRR